MFRALISVCVPMLICGCGSSSKVDPKAPAEVVIGAPELHRDFQNAAAGEKQYGGKIVHLEGRMHEVADFGGRPVAKFDGVVLCFFDKAHKEEFATANMAPEFVTQVAGRVAGRQEASSGKGYTVILEGCRLVFSRSAKELSKERETARAKKLLASPENTVSLIALCGSCQFAYAPALCPICSHATRFNGQ